jgi:hypothetical protein
MVPREPKEGLRSPAQYWREEGAVEARRDARRHQQVNERSGESVIARPRGRKGIGGGSHERRLVAGCVA